jgi:HSP20 family protein
MPKEKAMTEVKEAPKTTPNGPAPAKEAVKRPVAEMPADEVRPYNLVRKFAREIDRAFEDFGLATGLHLPSFLSRGHELLRREAGFVPAEWSPRIDMLQREGQLIVRADLPGMSKDDIKLEVSDDVLTIQGERNLEKKDEREGYCYSERSYGSFYRAVPLPDGARAQKATANFQNGVLEVSVPVPAQAEPKSRRVEIRDGK